MPNDLSLRLCLLAAYKIDQDMCEFIFAGVFFSFLFKFFLSRSKSAISLVYGLAVQHHGAGGM